MKIYLAKLFNLFFLSLVLLSPAWGVETKHYERVAKIQLPVSKTSGNFQAEIPLDLLEGTTNYDLRIYDAKQRELPYLVELSKDTEEEKVIPLKIYNQSSIKGQKQFLELVLNKNKLEEINQITLQAKENNFDRQVSVLGRDSEKEEWKLLKDNLRIMSADLPEQKIDFKFDSMLIPPSKYKFLRLEMSLNTNEKPLSIVSVLTKYQKEKQQLQYNKVDLPLQKVKLKSQTNLKNSYWLLNPKNKKYYFEKIAFEFNDDNFSRAVNLYCSPSQQIQYLDDSQLQLLNSTSFYKFQTVHNLEVPINEVNCKYYLLEIQQGDNLEVQPIKATGLSRKQFLKFIVEPPFQEPFTVYAKSNNDQTPNYDLAERLKQNKISEFVAAEIVDLKPNPEYQEKNNNSLEKLTYLPHIAAIALIILIALYIWNTVKNK